MQYKNTHSGFTLLETIVYIALFSMIFIAITNAIITFYQSNRYTLEQMSQLDSARKGVASLVSTLREATYSGSGAYPVESAGNNNITFYSNIDADAGIERVRYFLNGTDFMKGVIEPAGNPIVYTGSETIATTSQYIRNVALGVSVFQYFDTNGALMTVPPSTIDIRYVKINLVVNVNPATMPNEFTLRSSATLRNMKSNL